MKNNLNDKAIKILNELLEELKSAPIGKKVKYSSALNYIINYIQFNELSIETENVLYGDNCIFTDDEYDTGTYFKVPAVVGYTVTLMDKEYIIVHIENNVVYLILKYWEKDIQFNNNDNTNYMTSHIKNECDKWYNEHVPQELKDRGSMVNVTVNGVTSPCFIPDATMVNTTRPNDSGSWEHFFINDARIFKDNRGELHSWWTSTKHERKSGYAWHVTIKGGFNINYVPHNPSGFRPALAIKKCEFCG